MAEEHPKEVSGNNNSPDPIEEGRRRKVKPVKDIYIKFHLT